MFLLSTQPTAARKAGSNQAHTSELKAWWCCAPQDRGEGSWAALARKAWMVSSGGSILGTASQMRDHGESKG